MPLRSTKLDLRGTVDWRRFVLRFLGVLISGVIAIYLFVLLADPYDVIPFSLPIDRRIVSISDRFMYPQIVRSRRFDSLIIGTSTSRLLDPESLDRLFHVRIANLAMSSGMAWEQKTMLDLFLGAVGPPKVLIVGLDGVWCDTRADRHRTTFRGFPYWLYRDSPWKGFLYCSITAPLKLQSASSVTTSASTRNVFVTTAMVFSSRRSYNTIRYAHNDIWKGVSRCPRTFLRR